MSGLFVKMAKKIHFDRKVFQENSIPASKSLERQRISAEA